MVVMKEWMKRICPCITPSWIMLAERAWETVDYLFRGSVRFQLIFFLSRAFVKKLYNIHVTWFDRFVCREVTANRIKWNDHSCFHNWWPNSKTKLKYKQLWEQASQLAYSAYKEDRLWVHLSHFCKYFILSFHVTTLNKLHFATL